MILLYNIIIIIIGLISVTRDWRLVYKPMLDLHVHTIAKKQICTSIHLWCSQALNRPGIDFEGGGTHFTRYNCAVVGTGSEDNVAGQGTFVNFTKSI